MIAIPSPVVLGLFFFVIGQGSHAFYTARLICLVTISRNHSIPTSTMTNVPNFAPKYRGKVLGFLSCAFGFSAVVFAPLYEYMTGNGTSTSAAPSIQCNDTVTTTPDTGAPMFTTADPIFMTTHTIPLSDYEPIPFFFVMAVIELSMGIIGAVCIRRLPYSGSTDTTSELMMQDMDDLGATVTHTEAEAGYFKDHSRMLWASTII